MGCRGFPESSQPTLLDLRHDRVACGAHAYNSTTATRLGHGTRFGNDTSITMDGSGVRHPSGGGGTAYFAALRAVEAGPFQDVFAQCANEGLGVSTAVAGPSPTTADTRLADTVAVIAVEARFGSPGRHLQDLGSGTSTARRWSR